MPGNRDNHAILTACQHGASGLGQKLLLVTVGFEVG